MAKAKTTKAKVVEAVGTAASTIQPGPLGPLIEAAMTQAVTDAMADGITDPDEIRERKLAARERVKAEFAGGRQGK